MTETYQDCERLICYYANKFKNYYDIEDLIQVGRIGLDKAIKKYKEGYNAKFTTYAFLYIKGEILKYVREDKLIKFGKNYEKLNQSLEKAKEVLRQKLMREPTLEELSLFTEIDIKIIEEVSVSQELVKSLDYIVNEEDDGKDFSLYDTLSYQEKGYQEEILDLKEALGQLSEEERRIIQYRYYQDMTQQEISEKLGINQVKVSRTESKILEKLKRQLQV